MPDSQDKAIAETSRRVRARTVQWPDLLWLTAIVGAGSLLLLWKLDTPYLWQDEAATAVLGERLMRFGKPLAYDGRNLITMDIHSPAEEPQHELHSTSAQAGVEYFVRRGDFKADTTWIGQPWGQFLTAGASLALFGKGTLQARLPFALAGILVPLTLYVWIRWWFHDRCWAVCCAALLLGNTYWLLHQRQCRYYALMSLILVLTLQAYTAWQIAPSRRTVILFQGLCWAWFQVDFGSFWPAMGVLFGLALLLRRQPVRQTLLVGFCLAAAVAPFVWYYELLGRLKDESQALSEKAAGTLYGVNQYVIPLWILVLAGGVLWRKRREMQPAVWIPLVAGTGFVFAMLVWVPAVTPFAFHRYVVHLTPLGGLLCGWLIAESGRWLDRSERWGPPLPRLVPAGFTALLILTPVASLPCGWMIRPSATSQAPWWYRSELTRITDIFDPIIDPNRVGIEWARSAASTGDEILVNYEDIPFMFYTDFTIRGGIAAFRVREPDAAPRLAVLRRSAGFTHWNVYRHVIDRRDWAWTKLPAPDIPWGNNPDPYTFNLQAQGLIVGGVKSRRLEPPGPAKVRRQ